jgi:hypothetical protein
MSDQTKVQMNFHAPVTGVAGNVEHDQVIQSPNPSTLTEAVAEIQQLFDQLASSYPTTTEAEKATAVKAIQQQPELRGKIVKALEKGGKKAIEKLVDHPAAAIAIAIYEGFRDVKK